MTKVIGTFSGKRPSIVLELLEALQYDVSKLVCCSCKQNLELKDVGAHFVENGICKYICCHNPECLVRMYLQSGVNE